MHHAHDHGVRLVLAAFVVCVAGCTTIQTQNDYSGGPIPKPARIIVNDFAYSPDQVKLDSGITAEIAEAASGETRNEQELDVGRKVSIALSDELVKEIEAMGLSAERGSFPEDPNVNVALVRGQFISISEGNRTERVVIGLGAGRTDVEAQVQLYAVRGTDRTLLENMKVNAASGRTPGMAETMGVGAAAGNLAASAVIGAAGHGAGEAFGANVEADASRAAKNIAAQLKQAFARRGWIETAAE